MKNALGLVIKTFRKELNLKQIYMAHRLAITVQAYANIEHGRSDINSEKLKEISKIIGFKPFQLIALAEEILETDESCWLFEVVKKIVQLKQRDSEHYTKEDHFLIKMENSLKKSVHQ